MCGGLLSGSHHDKVHMFEINLKPSALGWKNKSQMSNMYPHKHLRRVVECTSIFHTHTHHMHLHVCKDFLHVQNMILQSKLFEHAPTTFPESPHLHVEAPMCQQDAKMLVLSESVQ